ncbi:MAG: hypothetical protein DHS20C19_02800 [Acidimicrobiales bacterium]|nr:MAG: hypothetical protein DHS20C19_02800 [Acidimicrobiales bacterium]
MQLRAGLHRLLFVLVMAAVVGVSSERMFWYWATNPLDHLVVAMVYAPAVGGCLWFIDRYRVRGLWGLVLVAPLMGYFVEGVITPVVYVGAPVPFFPVWFAFWHGVLGLAVIVFGLRRLLLERRAGVLWGAAAGLGAFWGMWSTTMWLPENVEDEELIADAGGALEILGPLDFAVYAFTFTAILAAAHWLLGRIWLTEFRPGRPMVWAWLAVVGAAVIGWTVAIPWAAPMFIGGVALQRWGLRRHAAGAHRSVLAELPGRIAPTALVPLVAMPVAAAAVYAVAWQLEPAEDLVRYGAMYGVIAVQTLVGAVLIVRSFLSVRSVAPADRVGHDQAHAVHAHTGSSDPDALAAPGAGAAGAGPVA